MLMVLMVRWHPHFSGILYTVCLVRLSPFCRNLSGFLEARFDILANPRDREHIFFYSLEHLFIDDKYDYIDAQHGWSTLLGV
jgi:hypothetical protein